MRKVQKYVQWIHTARERLYLGHCAGIEVLVKNIEDASPYYTKTLMPPERLRDWIDPKTVLVQGATEV